MKRNYIAYGAIFLMIVSLVSCFEEDEKYATKTLAAGDIIFSVPDAALTAPSAGQPQLTQPDINIVGGRFAISDDLKMTIGLSEGFSNLKVEAVNTSTGKRTEKKTFSGVSGSVDFTYPVNTLAVDNAAPTVGGTVILLFTASNADNSDNVQRAFTVSVVDPFALTSANSKDAANPTTAYADSTISLYYRTLPSTSLANVTKVEFFAKRGTKGTESLVASKDFATIVTPDSEKFTFKMPSEIPGQDLAKLDTMFLRFRATFATGKTVTKNATVRFISVPLSKTTSGVVLYNPAVTGSNSTKVSYDFGKLAYNKTTSPADPDAAKDILLTVSGSDIGITSGVGNATLFVKVDPAMATALYALPVTNPISYQHIRNAYEGAVAADASAAKSTFANVYSNDVYIAKIDGGKGSAQYVIFKVTAVNLTPGTDNTDNIVIEIKSK